MMDNQLHRARVVSSVAAILISLASGTNYVYSAWAPQFADKLRLTATESNLIGLAGNLGMYSLGVPVGMFVDNKGPRLAVIGGAVLLGVGYFPFRAAYNSGTGSVLILCFFGFLTGLGGCMAFIASIKTSALNWPHHRGTATAFPLAAFGLSAFFFSFFGSLFFPGDTSAFLGLLAAGTFGLAILGFFFLRVVPHNTHTHTHSHSHGPYQPVPSGASESPVRRRTDERKRRPSARKQHQDVESGESPTAYLIPAQGTGLVEAAAAGGRSVGTDKDTQESPAGPYGSGHGLSRPSPPPPLPPVVASSHIPVDAEAVPASASLTDELEDALETSSLVSTCSTSSSLPGELLVHSVDLDRSHRVDIRGWRLLRNVEFWQLFAIMGIMAGIGLMTINNIGHNTNALWKKYDSSVGDEFLIGRQQMHVSVLSVASFAGRLCSGVGSDFLVKTIKASRVWCLAIANVVFCIAQVLALNVMDPHYLVSVSAFSGLGYGFLYGVFPSIVAESFGIHGLSQNWGFMTLAPVISGNIFNIFYGAVFDTHSLVMPDGERACLDGIDCYRTAYVATLSACALGLVVTLLVIRHQYLERLREETGKGSAED